MVGWRSFRADPSLPLLAVSPSIEDACRRRVEDALDLQQVAFWSNPRISAIRAAVHRPMKYPVARKIGAT
jgi:hypothetical protein